jgi:hypothetical protein
LAVSRQGHQKFHQLAAYLLIIPLEEEAVVPQKSPNCLAHFRGFVLQCLQLKYFQQLFVDLVDQSSAGVGMLLQNLDAPLGFQ